MMAEKWKDVKGFEGFYMVSNRGRVKSLARYKSPKEFIMKTRPDKDGYLEFSASTNGKRKFIKVHRAVYEAFVGPIPDGYVINHRNNIKTTNFPTNLEAITKDENARHAKEWRQKYGVTFDRKFTRDEILTIRWEIEMNICRREIAARWGTTPSRIYRIESGETYSSIK